MEVYILRNSSIQNFAGPIDVFESANSLPIFADADPTLYELGVISENSFVYYIPDEWYPFMQLSYYYLTSEGLFHQRIGRNYRRWYSEKRWRLRISNSL